MQSTTAAEAHSSSHLLTSPRLVIITPVRDEVAHIDMLVQGMAAQTRAPDKWIVVDDDSSDGTRERLESLQPKVPYMQVITKPSSPGERDGADRLARGSCVRAFNYGLANVGVEGFDFVGKLDGDIELVPEYFERLLERFELDPSLGIVGGDLAESKGGEWRRVPLPPHHVPGALKLYRRECLAAIGSLPEGLGWDTIDETYARMRGFRTRSFGEVIARHHRPIGARDGLLRGRARHGECAYVSHFTPTWVTLRALKLATWDPIVLSGIAFLYGYCRAAVRGRPRVADDEFRAFVHRELRRRMLGGLRSALAMERS